MSRPKFLYLGQLELMFSNVWSPHELLHGRPKTTRLGWKRINTNNYNFGCNGFRRWMFSWKQLVFFTLNYIYKLPLFDILRISYHPTYFFSNKGPLAMYPACCPHRASQILKAWNSIVVGELWLDFYFYLHWVLVWDGRSEIKFGDFKLGWFNNQSIGERVFYSHPFGRPWARSHLHSVGSRPSDISFTAAVFLHAPVWVLFPIGNQCDNIMSLEPLSSFGMWRNSIN